MSNIDPLCLNIRIGDDFSKLLEITNKKVPVDMTGYSFKMQIRKNKGDATAILTLVSPTNIDISDVANGNIIITISNAVTTTLVEQQAVYDLKWTTDLGIVTTILEGAVQIQQTVTE
jgi:hypothetical protein